MKKILKAPNNLVRRAFSKSSNISSSREHHHKGEKKSLMSEEQQLEVEIKSLKVQVENLKAAISTLQEDTEKKEIAIARIAREKEKITMELLKQRRSNNSLLQQLEDERKYYYKEKEIYCQEMNQYKKLRQTLSSTSTSNTNKDEMSAEQYKREIAKVKQTLNQTLEANYNLSIKFLRMKNTKTCLKTELKTMQLEHEKLVNDYKARIQNLSEELHELIQEKLNSPSTSCSSKKYLHLVKQNSVLVYENLCLQLEVDNLHLKYEKLKLNKTKSETNSRLKYIKHESSRSPKKNTEKDRKRVRIREDVERPEKLEKANNISPAVPSTSQQAATNEAIHKIFERHHSPGIPNIRILNNNDSETSHATTQSNNRPPQIPTIQEKGSRNALQKNMKNVSAKTSSKLDLFQVSNVSSRTSTATNNGSLIRVHSSPEIVATRSILK